VQVNKGYPKPSLYLKPFFFPYQNSSMTSVVGRCDGFGYTPPPLTVLCGGMPGCGQWEPCHPPARRVPWRGTRGATPDSLLDSGTFVSVKYRSPVREGISETLTPKVL
jgi:hypothetical protein